MACPVKRHVVCRLPPPLCRTLNRRCNMHRVTICALALWGTLSVAACDEHGNEPGLLAATAAATPEVSQALSMPVHVTTTAQISGCNSGQGVSVALNGQLALPGLGARLSF